MHEITKDYSGLEADHIQAAKTYLIGAAQSIDALCGPDYAVTHPELLAAMLMACATLDAGVMPVIAAQKICDAIDNLAHALAEQG